MKLLTIDSYENGAINSENTLKRNGMILDDSCRICRWQ